MPQQLSTDQSGVPDPSTPENHDSSNAKVQDLENELEQAQRSIDTQHKQKNILATSLLASLVLLALTGIALYQAGPTISLAHEHEARAQEQMRKARAGELAAEAQLVAEEFPQRGLLLAASSNGLSATRPPEVAQALYQGLQDSGGWPLVEHTDAILVVAFSPVGDWAATGSIDHTIRLWSLERNQPNGLLETVVLEGHTESIHSLVFTPDGRWLISGSGDKTIRVWDVERIADGETSVIRILRGKFGGSKSLTSDGLWLATVSEDENSAAIWNVDSLTQGAALPPKLLPDLQDGINSLEFSPDGRWLVAEEQNGTLRIWPTPEVLAGRSPASTILPNLGNNRVNDLTFSTDGQWLAASTDKNGALLWHIKTLEAGTAPEPMLLRGHEGYVSALAFSPDGHWLATGSFDHNSRLWDLQRMRPDDLPVSTVFRAHTKPIYALTFSPDSRWLATSGADKTTRLWDLAKYSDYHSPEPIILRGHDAAHTVLAFSNDSRLLLTGSQDGTARIWDVMATGAIPKVLHGHTTPVVTLAFTPDSHWLATSGGESDDKADYAIRLWDLWDLAAKPRKLSGHSGITRVLAFSPDNVWLASGSQDGTARLWDMRDPRLPAVVLDAHGESVNTLAFSSGGHWLVTASSDKTVGVWDIQAVQAVQPGNSFKPLALLPGHKDKIHKLSLSSDGHWMATGSTDGMLRLWDMRPLEENQLPTSVELPEHKRRTAALAFSPDGRWLVAGDEGGLAWLWDLNNLQPGNIPAAAGLRGYRLYLRSLAFSPDGRWLVSSGVEDEKGDGDERVRLWDMQEVTAGRYAPWKTLHEHVTGARNPTFSADGRWLAINEWAFTWLWDLQHLEAGPVVLRENEAAINDMRFSPDGRWLATVNRDSQVRLWPIRVNKLVDLACSTAGRNLTQAEWEQYFPDHAYSPACSQWPAGK